MRKRLIAIAFAAAFALSLSTLQISLSLDDLGQVMRVRGQLPDWGGRYDLFRFTPRDPAQMARMISNGPYPWWSYPDLQVGFFRPLSSLLVALDVNVIGDHPLLWHLHSIAWYAALLLVALAFYRRVLPAHVAPVALLAFAIDDSHWMPVGWLANRNGLVAVTFALLGLLLHLKWREDGWRIGAVLSALCFALGLAGGESALGLLGFVFLYEVMNVRGQRLRTRALSLLPLLTVVVPWQVLYRAYGYGARGSAIYVDPVSDPLGFLQVAPGRALALIGSMTLNISADLWVFLGNGRAVLVIAGVVGAGLFTLFIRAARPSWPDAEWRRLRWLLLCALCAVVPVAATFPADRLVIVASVASAAIIASLLHALWKDVSPTARFARVLLVITAFISPLPGWVFSPWWMNLISEHADRGLNDVAFTDDALAGHVLLFNAPDPFVALYGGATRMIHGKRGPQSWQVLSFAPFSHRLTRVRDDAFELEVVGGALLGTVMEQLVRAPRYPLDAGAVVRIDGLTVTVLAATDGRPTRFRVELTRPLNDFTLAQWKGARLAPLALPAVGESVLLAHESGPMDLLGEVLSGRFSGR